MCRRFLLYPAVCVRSRAASGPAGHPRGVLCPSVAGLLRAVVNTPIRSSEATPFRRGLIMETIWAIGDLHGDLHCARSWLRRTGVVNLTTWQWADENARLIFMGDYIDKGADSRAVLELVKKLTTVFPSHVTALLGNHELNLLIDRTRSPGDRYLDYAYAAAHPAQYTHWLPTDTARDPPAERRVLDALYAALQQVYAHDLQARIRMAPTGGSSIVNLVAEEARADVASHLVEWQAAYMRGVAADAPLGVWLQQRPTSALLGDTLFVHGGVPPNLLHERGISSARELAALHLAWRNVSAVVGASEAAASAIAMALATSPFLHDISELVEYRGYHDKARGCARVSNVLLSRALRLPLIATDCH